MANPPPGAPAARQTVRVGAHTVAFESPDTYVIRQVGDFNVSEVGQVFDALDQMVGTAAELYALIDFSLAGKVAAEARKLLLARMPKATRGVVFVGASPIARIGLSLGKKAYLMMYRGRDLAHQFADTDDEARAWIAAQRKPGAR